MRADRLVAMMLLLQKNGRSTAASLAAELEVSGRTIYRDVDALSAAGVPVYAQPGPGGGISLLDSFRTDLTGLTTAEMQALLTLSIPAPLLTLGVGADLRSALRKLSAAVPTPREESGAQIQERFLIDDTHWSQSAVSGSLFESIRQALWQNHELTVSYRPEFGDRAGPITTTLQPLGLVAADGEWYLVAGHGDHSIVVPFVRLLSAEVTNIPFERPSDFQLETTWHARKALVQQQRPAFYVRARIAEIAFPYITEFLVDRPGSKPGDLNVHLRFSTFEEARTRILGLGSAIEVLDPLSLRLSIKDHAQQVLSVYERS